MRRISFFVALALVLGATVGVEMLFGRYASWKAQQEALADARQRIERIPRSFGPWTMTSETAFAQNVINMLECSGYINRTYVHEKTGESVQAVLLAGPAGPMLVHRPEICMDGQGYKLVDGPKRVLYSSTGQNRHYLFRTTFSSRQRTRIQVYYGWSRRDEWEAPESPRLTLGGEPMLYKLQIVSTGQPNEDEKDAGHRFLKEFLPALTSILAPRTDSPTGAVRQ